MLPEAASISLQDHTLFCRGTWSVHHVAHLNNAFQAIPWTGIPQLLLDGSDITHFDTAAALLMEQWKEKWQGQGVSVQLHGFSPSASRLLTLVSDSQAIPEKISHGQDTDRTRRFFHPWISMLDEAWHYFAFVGRIAGTMGKVLRHPRQFKLSLLADQINLAGCQALPIIALLSSMIGIVISYQLGIQLATYGASLYVADLVGMSMMREFAPLVTAILLAGRTGAAFTAELGMMKITQEIDALQTMGISPETLLVLPRLTALVIVLPLLTLWADVFGILGGMLMSVTQSGIGWHDFLDRVRHHVPVRMLVIGLGKAPVFALIIAGTGCFEGLRVNGTAESLGRNTTRSVVRSIFLIILADAVFSILFSRLRL